MGMGEHRVSDHKPKPERNDAMRTPEPVLRHAHDVFGGIGLDPAGHPDGIYATTTVLLPKYVGSTPKVYGWVPQPHWVVFGDGLDISWGGSGLVVANPPWSDLEPWLTKGSEDGDEVLFILPARLNAVYFHEQFFDTCGEALGFPRHRVQYQGGQKQQNPYHSMFAYYGSRYELFAEFVRRIPGYAVKVRG